MEFENEFTVPVPPERAWAALMDMDQVAQCMPGATLLDNTGDRFTGKVKVKVGPITVSYQGAAEFLEKDQSGGRAVLSAKGREERGAGTAGMTVVALLEPVGAAETRVRVLTDLDITGKPAQFGRGVMSEVGTAIIGRFATNLAQQLTAEPTPAAKPTKNGAPAGADTTRDTAVGTPATSVDARTGPDDNLDLGAMLWAPTLRRAMPVLAGAALGVALTTLLRAKGTPPALTVVLAPPGEMWSVPAQGSIPV